MESETMRSVLQSLLCLKLLLILLFLFPLTNITFAQTTAAPAGSATFGVARMIETNEKDIKDGNILSSKETGSVLSNTSYDPQVLGVVSNTAAIVLSSTNSKTAVPVVSTGTVYITVSSQDGAIKKGDLLTTSTIPGVAVKANKDGYVLGRALEDYANSNTKEIGTIAIDLNLHYFNSKPTFLGSLSDVFKIALLPTKDSPTPIFKYIVAAAVLLASIALGFVSFGRTAAKGVEALGRNPSASRIIHLGIIFNVAIVIVIVFAGLAVAFLILRL
jgi:F0F1-type ATP synthase membrane subunit c/vacuolar-type H+-ATPase subunit K